MLTSQIEIEHVDQFATRDTSSKADQTAATRQDWQYQGRERDRTMTVLADQAEIERVDQLLPAGLSSLRAAGSVPPVEPQPC